MTLKSILVHVDQSHTKHPVEAAAYLAEKFDAHVSGLATEEQLYIPAYVTTGVPREILQISRQHQKTRLQEAEAVFKDVMSLAGRLDQTSWESLIDEAPDALARRARVNDLVVISQKQPEDQGRYSDSDTEDIVTTAEGGVLVVPHIGFDDTIGTSILLAWNDSNESARAVKAAMPILEAAKQVEVLIVAKGGEDDFTGSEVSRYLSEHGIEVTLNIAASGSIGVSDIILNEATEKGHDLVVMGAYSHTRLREAILGGTTKDIFRHMTVPVLFGS